MKTRIRTVLFATLATCACNSVDSLRTGVTTNVPSSRLTDAQYTSPDGEYTVQVPRLIKPGARVEEGETDAAARMVTFSDDFGRIYMVEMSEATQQAPTIEEFAASLALDQVLREKELVATDRGQELRAVFVVPGGSPLIAQTYEKGAMTEQKLDLIQARSLFRTREHVFTVSASHTRLEDERPDAELIALAKESLETFLAGLVVREP